MDDLKFDSKTENINLEKHIDIDTNKIFGQKNEGIQKNLGFLNDFQKELLNERKNNHLSNK